jgi:hypothetical protein
LRPGEDPPPHLLHLVDTSLSSAVCGKELVALIKDGVTMNEMYTGLACLVLFDARGEVPESAWIYVAVVLCVSVFILSLAYLPHAFHRPALVDTFCADVLSITVHTACIGVLSDPLLRHACALHSVCFCIQTRFLSTKNAIQPVLLHTMLVLLLAAAYVYGPRITEIKQFMIGAVCPHVLELGAHLLASLHGVLVTFWLEKST